MMTVQEPLHGAGQQGLGTDGMVKTNRAHKSGSQRLSGVVASIVLPQQGSEHEFGQVNWGEVMPAGLQ